MPSSTFSNSKYTYFHDDKRSPLQTIDIHEIIISKSRGGIFLSYLWAFLLLLFPCHLLLIEGKLGAYVIWSLILGALIFRSLWSKNVKKESVVIMPTFGVQLETHYWSGRVARHFISIGKIIQPVLNECVTPVTCYWSLALILRGEDKLMLVFQELCPPVEMLVPVWKALCSVTDGKECL